MANALSNNGNVPAFPEQFSNICSWFNDFSPSEQLIVLYTLFYKLSWAETRFSINVLEKRVQTEPVDPSYIVLENEANDVEYIASLQTAGKEHAMSALLSHLPVLRPGNAAALDQYICVLDSVMQYVAKSGMHRNNAMQLLSLAVVHPAVPTEHRDNLARWRDKLNGSGGGSIAVGGGSASGIGGSKGGPVLPPSGAAAPAATPNHSGMVVGAPSGPAGPGGGTAPNHFLPSMQGQVPPPSRNWHPSVDHYGAPPPAPPPPSARFSPSHQLLAVPHPDGRAPIRSSSMQMADVPHVDDGMERNMSRSQSLPMPVRQGQRPSGSETSFADGRAGMKEVPHWLKGLRLHKYQDLFSEMTYEEMLGLTDEVLSRKGVTTGARHKILVSIQKLRQRYDLLQRMLKDVESPSKLMPVINELKYVLNSPMKPYAPLSGVGSSTSSPETSLPPDITGVTGAASLPTSLPSAPLQQQSLNSMDNSSSRTSPAFDSSASAAAANTGGQWPSVERQESDNGAMSNAEMFEHSENTSRAPAKNSISSVSSVSSSNSSNSHHGSDAGPSPSPTNGLEHEDLPGLVVEVIVKACSQLVDCGADEDTCTSFLNVVDKAMTHEAFTADHRRVIFGLRQKCNNATRLAQRKNLHETRYLRSNWLPNMGNMPGFHPHPGHALPMATTQSLPRNLPPPPPTAAAAAALNVINATHRRRGYERQNARNSNVTQPHPMPVPAPVAMPPPQMPGPVGPPPVTNPFGAPGSGRRSSGLAPVLMPDSERSEVWANPADYSNLIPPEQDPSGIGVGSTNGTGGGSSAVNHCNNGSTNMLPHPVTSTTAGGGGAAGGSVAVGLDAAYDMSAGSVSLQPGRASVNGVPYSSANDSYMEHLCRSMTEHALDEKSERDQQ